LGYYEPCWICGGEGYIDEEDFYDAGCATPGALRKCHCCNDGEQYNPLMCPNCDIE